MAGREASATVRRYSSRVLVLYFCQLRVFHSKLFADACFANPVLILLLQPFVVVAQCYSSQTPALFILF